MAQRPETEADTAATPAAGADGIGHKRWDALTELVGALDESVSLWDADMRFVMCNDKYMADMASYRSEPYPPGMRGEEAIAEVYHSRTLKILPEGATEAEIVGY